MLNLLTKTFWIVLLLVLLQDPRAEALDAQSLVENSFNYMRDKSSVAVVVMTVHRPDWERKMTIKAWTRGLDESLFFITEPSRDRGNGTLKKGREMWVFNPKVNRVVKLPPSMMSQAWMGSDFSNKDVSRADDIVDQYTHTLLETATADGLKVYVIESIPLEEAAVVWGKEVLRVRDDYVLLKQEFWDQDGVLVKTLESLEIGEMGGRTIALRQRMAKTDTDDEWTEFSIQSMEFDIEISDNTFTRSNLQNPRD